MANTSSYADWKAPAQDSQLLIWPQPGRIAQDAVQTHLRLNGDDRTRIQNVSIAELRNHQRTLLGIATDRPVIATGHQTELYHAGVWAKLALLSAVAPQIDAQSLLLAVDTDAPKHLHLRWPGGSQPITDDPRLTTAQWSRLLNGPSPTQLSILRRAFEAAKAQWPFKPMADQFIAELQAQSSSGPSLSTAIVEAMHKLDESLGLKHRAMIVSPVFETEPYLALVHHILARADEFAAIYNGGLADYRISHRLRTKARPMPDLQVATQEIEAPFWLDHLDNQTRDRAAVQRQGDGWKISIGGEEFALNRQADGWVAASGLREFLHRHKARLSPRALTLTLFARLLLVDQFVHGIGGGRYDQVTDQVIDGFFKLPPPPFSVTTATLYFPTAVGRTRACLPCLVHEGHRLRHRVLGEPKMELVRQIEQLPRRSMGRRQIFSKMHNELSEALVAHPSIKAWETRVAQTERRMAEEGPLFDRELFYALQPRDRLMGLIERYQEEFAKEKISHH